MFIGAICRHKNTSWAFHDDEGDYCRCLDCGARIPNNTFTEKQAA